VTIEFGYHLSSEEHPAKDLIGYARRAEEVGFDFAMISDHFHPWTDRQGHAPFVWSVMGAIAQVTERLRLGTGVTCPTIRTHPLIIAQAAATVSTMMPGRFFLGVGTGERLSEHVLGNHWPPSKIRLEMLSEAIDVLRLFWEGKLKIHRGRYFTVESARIYDIPQSPVDIMVSASGSNAAKLAAEKGDGLISIAPNDKLVRTYEEAGGKGKSKFAKIAVCWAEDEETARKTAHRQWPIDSLPGRLLPELRLPKDFEAAAELVDEEAVAEKIVCGPDPERHLARIKEFVDAGYDHIYIHQIGTEQESFFQFYEKEMLPKLRKEYS
jgi:G6PDH family F420-dependent oxidoreductase